MRQPWEKAGFLTEGDKTMGEDKKAKCANPQCSCMAEPGSKYCSPVCEGAEDMDIAEIGCGCAHADCSGKVTS